MNIKLILAYIYIVGVLLTISACSCGDKTHENETSADGGESERHLAVVDTSKQNILLIGESMVEGLAKPFANYCAANGHGFNSVCWYSSTTRHWVETDTLEYFLNKFNPTYVFVTIGGNEQFLSNLESRENFINQILKRIGNRKVVWLGTPAWKKDTGINDLTLKILGKDRYYDARNLKIARKKDGAHPTPESSSLWMDSIAAWISSDRTRYPIVFNHYSDTVKNMHLNVLQPMKL